MTNFNKKSNNKNDIKLESIILKLAEEIQNGTMTIIKQDSVVIQINTFEKFVMDEEYLAVG
ncbi:MAG: DUF2292 domain-containing protein [Bacillota bacterium]|nr:DUF2292 domain-containing protein [Bacillota bacterium]